MDASPLARLPPELRNWIYETLLHVNRPICITTSKHTDRAESFRLKPPEYRPELGAGRPAIHEEGRKMLYGMNTFHLLLDYKPGLDEWSVHKQLPACIGVRNMHALRTITFKLMMDGKRKKEDIRRRRLVCTLRNASALASSLPMCKIDLEIVLQCAQNHAAESRGRAIAASVALDNRKILRFDVRDLRTSFETIREDPFIMKGGRSVCTRGRMMLQKAFQELVEEERDGVVGEEAALRKWGFNYRP